MRRGEIWWATLPDPMGSEPGFRRPVLIIQANTFNQSAINTVMCAPITSNLRIAAAPGNVRIGIRSSGLSKPSVVNVSQVMTYNKTMLTERVKLLDARSMRQVDEGLRIALCV